MMDLQLYTTCTGDGSTSTNTPLACTHGGCDSLQLVVVVVFSFQPLDKKSLTLLCGILDVSMMESPLHASLPAAPFQFSNCVRGILLVISQCPHSMLTMLLLVHEILSVHRQYLLLHVNFLSAILLPLLSVHMIGQPILEAKLHIRVHTSHSSAGYAQ